MTIVGITIDGDIYPCHDFAGRFATDAKERTQLVLGNVQHSYSPDGRTLWRAVERESATPESGYDCQTCWAKWACGKGCPYMNYAHSGDATRVNPVYCEMTRINALLVLRWMSMSPDLCTWRAW